MMNNPNRFITGLDDIGQIVDNNVNPRPVITGPEKTFIVIPNPDRSLDNGTQVIVE